MCEFCLKHGDGEKWYLEAKNYSEDLLSDLRRQKAVTHFVSNRNVQETRRDVALLEYIERAPAIVQRVLKVAYGQYYKIDHWGQVLPIEDVERVFEIVNSVALVPCFCRYVNHGTEHGYCYGISMGPNGGVMSQLMNGLDCFFGGPDSRGLQLVSKQDALAHMRKLERQGACHTVWTFRHPFIGGICNCDRADCLAMSTTLDHETQLFYRAEYLARIDPERCKGCRQCMRVCQFGAITYSAAHKRSFVDPRRCYGCGICRAMCRQGSIGLVDRRADPVAARLW